VVKEFFHYVYHFYNFDVISESDVWTDGCGDVASILFIVFDKVVVSYSTNGSGTLWHVQHVNRN